MNTEFTKFSAASEAFLDNDSLHDKGFLDPKHWWVVYGSSFYSKYPTLQALTLKIFGQPYSSSCCERN